MRSDGCTQIRCVCGTEWNWQVGGCNGRFERDAMIPKGLMSAENMGSQDLRTAE